MKYTLRNPPKIEAVQWDGSAQAWEDILGLSGVHHVSGWVGNKFELRDYDRAVWTLNSGDFVVSNGGKIEVYAADTFHKMFKELP